MLASHDSYTFLRARRRWARWASPLWRTQSKGIAGQVSAGVRYFDVRVRWDSRAQVYRVCHGLVDFDLMFYSLAQIVNLFAPNLVRIILERGDSGQFGKDAEKLESFCGIGVYGNLHVLAVKHPWRSLYRAGTVLDPQSGLRVAAPAVIDRSYVPWDTGKSFWQNLRSLRLSTIRSWARLHPPSPAEAADPERVYFHDFV